MSHSSKYLVRYKMNVNGIELRLNVGRHFECMGKVQIYFRTDLLNGHQQ